jgi:hypothetical protein
MPPLRQLDSEKSEMNPLYLNSYVARFPQEKSSAMLGGGIQKCLHWGFYWCAIVCLAAAALQEQHKPRSNVAEYEAPRVFCGQSTWTDDYVVIFLGAPGNMGCCA